MANRKPYVRWIIAAAVLLLFILIMVVLDRTLTLDTFSRWLLRIGFVVLGLIAAGSIVWFLRPRDADPPKDLSDEVLLTINAARDRLPRGQFAKRPMVILVGPQGAAKTTVVARSGGDPELMAGDAPKSTFDAPTSTKSANLWAMNPAILIELGAGLLSDKTKWSKVVRALRAPRLAAALGQGEPAARSVVICVPCDLFYAGNNGEQLESLAQMLRQRLAEVSRELGLAVPVYVVFTKMDRIPHFDTWIAPFTKDELRAPLGASLPFDAASTSGSYAERLTPRIEYAFQQIVHSLALNRIDTLGRDTVLEHRYGAYELPREVRKVQPVVTNFLVELCRPTQLGSNPQLRGFYFVGARPVVVTDVAAAATQQPAAQHTGSDATRVFRVGAQPQAAAAATGVPTSRKVPEWVFQERFLREVVLADTGAASVARGGVRVQRARRYLLAGSIAASMLLLLGATISWLGNRAINNRVTDAARAVAALPVVTSTPGTITFPSAEALRRLEALRAQLDTVRQYNQDGPPWRLRWGLWRGNAVLEAARPVWYTGFRQQLFATSWGALVDSLKALPLSPDGSSDYGTMYSWLKGYLITTSDPDRSTSEFLAPVLLKSWQRGQETDADITDLARRQFEFYASELPTYNPYPTAAEASLVSRARALLRRFTGGEQIYIAMVAAANKATPSIKLPQAPGILTVQPEVPGAFTNKGEAFMANAFANADQYFQGETWVVGDVTAERSGNRDEILASLRAQYQDEYIKTWRQVVQSATVARSSSVADAAKKLEILGGTQSPILQVLRIVAVNTDGDSVIRSAFQPVHAVTPPEVTDKFVSEKNQPYMDGLLGLQGALAQVANLPPATDTASTLTITQAAQQAGGDVTRARMAAKKVAQEFSLTPEATTTAGTVERLLDAPIVGAEVVLKNASNMRIPVKRVAVAPPVAAPAPSGGGGAPPPPNPATVLNERGRALCSAMTPMLAKFPFNPTATAEASVAEVTAMLAPGTGALWAFQQERLAPFLEEKGGKWVAKPVGTVALSASFVEFFNRAAQISEALFPDNAKTLQLRWMARGITSDATPIITLKHGAYEARFDARTPRNEILWPPEAGREATLEAVFKKNKPVVVAKASGDWALFRLVAQATRFDGTGRVEWAAQGKDAVPVVVEFDAPNGMPILKRGWLGGMTCVGQVTQ